MGSSITAQMDSGAQKEGNGYAVNRDKGKGNTKSRTDCKQNKSALIVDKWVVSKPIVGNLSQMCCSIYRDGETIE